MIPFKIKGNHLPARMHAGIRSPGADDAGLQYRDLTDRPFYRRLDRRRRLWLSLKALVSAPIVSQDSGVAPRFC